MDELQLLRGFRADLASADAAARARVRTRVEAAVSGERWIRWRVRQRSAWAAAAVAVLAAVIATSAFAFGDRLLSIVAGEPAPPQVKRTFAVENDAQTRAVMPIFRREKSLDTIVQRTHGVLGINTSVGPVIVWAAPTRGGGVCWVVDIERLRSPDGRPNGGSGCNRAPIRPSIALESGLLVRSVGNAYLELVEGRVSDTVASVELHYADGSTEDLPLAEGFILHEPRRDAEPVALVARDANGAEVKRRSVRRPSARVRDRFAEPTGPERVVVRLETSAGFPVTFSTARSQRGYLCEITRFRGSEARSCGPDRRDRVKSDEISVHAGLWNNFRDDQPLVTLSGVVGADVAQLELHYRDGEVVDVPIAERFVLFEIPPAKYEEERLLLVARDRRGGVVNRRTIN
jgi:hypothetical protein